MLERGRPHTKPPGHRVDEPEACTVVDQSEARIEPRPGCAHVVQHRQLGEEAVGHSFFRDQAYARADGTARRAERPGASVDLNASTCDRVCAEYGVSKLRPAGPKQPVKPKHLAAVELDHEALHSR